MKVTLALLVTISLGGPVGTVWSQIPINPQNRIINGKIYDPQKSPLWKHLPAEVTTHGSSLKVTSIGEISLVCEVFRTVFDDGGRYGIFQRIGEEYVKTILVYNHPAHSAMTTETVIDERGKTPTTKPFLAMRAGNWRTNKLVLEAYDCGLPDTAENRMKAGIAIPTAEELAAPARQAAEAAAGKKQAVDVKALNWNMEQAAKGDAYGLLRMGQRYRDGDGVQKDMAKATEYFTKAVQAGSPSAEAELSRLNQASTNAPDTK
jgi:hypothetical protein